MSSKSADSFLGLSESLHAIFQTVLKPLGSAALVLPDGTALYVQPNSPADVATLSQASALCHRYLNLAAGDVALTNDPYSGGTMLSEFTLVMGVAFHPTHREIDLLLVQRIAFSPHLPSKLKVEEEGVRVPPTPLASNAQLNRDLLSAIASHPLAPPTLFSKIETALQDLSETAEVLRRIARDPGSILRKTTFENYIEDSSRVFEHLMSRLPLGTVSVSGNLSSGELIKLSLKITDDQLLFDFAGSDNSTTVALTEHATFGACWAATVASVGEDVPMNQGSFQHLQVSAPSRTFLSATPPTATSKGITEGISAVCRLVHEAIGKLQSGYRTASGPDCSTLVQIAFDDRRTLHLSLPPGSGAASHSRGLDASSAWISRDLFLQTLRNPESLELDFPIQLIELGRRQNSGGIGKHPGGRGVIVAFEVKAAGELRWMDSSLGRKFSGSDGGKAGTAAAIEIIRKTQKKDQAAREEHIEASGSARIAEGDRVYILTGGGGGFGAPLQENESSVS